MGVMNTFAGIICIIALLFLLYREKQRKDRRRLGWRMMATIIAVLGLYLLLVPVKCKRKELPSGNVAVLCTTGFSKDTLTALLDRHPDALVVDENSIWKINPGFSTLHIIGDGFQYPLNDAKLPDDIIFHPGPFEQNRFAAIHWNNKLIAGESLVVQGTYQNKSGRPLRIFLSGFNTVADSLELSDTLTPFALTAVPRNNGPGVFQVYVVDGTDTLENNPVSFEVITSDKPALLMLAAYPDFENKFLQSWLSAADYKVMSRVRISQQKFERNFYNTPARTLERITKDVLDSVDVVMIDEEELKQLRSGERNLLKEYLQSNRIGMMIRADSAYAGRHLFSGNNIARVSSFSGDKILLQIKGKSERIELKNNGSLNYLNKSPHTVSIVNDTAGHSFARLAMWGKGKLLLNALPPIYPLMISGDKAAYASVWSTLLQSVTPAAADSISIFATTTIPQVDLPVGLEVQTISTSPPVLKTESGPLPLQQHEWLQGRYTATYWPLKTGWQTFSDATVKVFTFYVFDSSHWRGIRAMESNKYTKNLILQKTKGNKAENYKNDFSTFPLSPIYWLVLFILSAGYLWIERKIP